jgi:hypothetical protein
MNSRHSIYVPTAQLGRPSRTGLQARLLLACGTLLTLPACLIAASAPASPAPAAPAAAAPEAKAGPEAGLQRGMSAADVKKIMGAPATVQAMEAPSGKAEIWTYTREIESRSAQVQVGSKPITITQTDANNQIHTTTIAEEPIFKMQHVTVVEQVDLLMFNDHFLEKKVTKAKRARYD